MWMMRKDADAMTGRELADSFKAAVRGAMGEPDPHVRKGLLDTLQSSTDGDERLDEAFREETAGGSPEGAPRRRPMASWAAEGTEGADEMIGDHDDRRARRRPNGRHGIGRDA